MPKVPRLKGREVLRALRRAGFEVIRIKGSHHYLRHADGRATTVPVHAGESIGIGLFMKILKDVDMGVEEFRTLL
jgi:predicted RNA binding protein YcfA (HicA-like mRNA interferase family)